VGEKEECGAFGREKGEKGRYPSVPSSFLHAFDLAGKKGGREKEVTAREGRGKGGGEGGELDCSPYFLYNSTQVEKEGKIVLTRSLRGEEGGRKRKGKRPLYFLLTTPRERGKERSLKKERGGKKRERKKTNGGGGK